MKKIFTFLLVALLHATSAFAQRGLILEYSGPASASVGVPANATLNFSLSGGATVTQFRYTVRFTGFRGTVQATANPAGPYTCVVAGQTTTGDPGVTFAIPAGSYVNPIIGEPACTITLVPNASSASTVTPSRDSENCSITVGMQTVCPLPAPIFTNFTVSGVGGGGGGFAEAIPAMDSFSITLLGSLALLAGLVVVRTRTR